MSEEVKRPVKATLDGENYAKAAESENERANAADAKVKKEEAIEQQEQESKRKKRLLAGGSLYAGHKLLSALKPLMLLKFMQMMAMMLLQAARSFVAGIIKGISNFFQGILSTIGHFAGTVAGIFGVSFTTGAVGVVACGGMAFTMTVAGIFGAISQNNMKDDTIVESCVTDVDSVASNAALGNFDAQTMINAQMTNSVLSEWGMPSENIAGILGNWIDESGIDPTGVETIYNEKFQIGPKKQAAIMADFDIKAINPAYAAAHPLIEHCGIGLGQWTNSRNRLLVNFATAAGRPWYTMDVQLAFMIAPENQGGDSRSNWMLAWAGTQELSPEAAAETFCTDWEGITFEPERATYAATVFVQMAEWSVDKSYANSIIEMANTTLVNATDGATGRALENCQRARKVDNSTIADAAVAYAWETQEMGRGNDGTQTYISVHNAVLPGDSIYKACDRSVACAVRWSGSDDSYPAGPVATQLSYLQTSDKWSEVHGWGGNPANLQPGDVLIRKDASVSHTLLYVGNAAIRKRYPDADASYMVVSGSLGERSPGCGRWSNNAERGYQTYRVFRNIKKETNSAYKDAAISGIQRAE